MKLIVAIMVLVVSCNKPVDVPPPIAQGTCLVDRYEGSAALQQTCMHVGYFWACVREEKDKRFILMCTRGEEAKGERPFVKPTIPSPPAGSGQ